MTPTTVPRTVRWAFFLCTALPALAGLVQNPSFEGPYNPTWPHYGSADSWAGANGTNDNTGPFHNTGTAVPDQGLVGFKQGTGSVTQDISGLDPTKKYWLQYFYDARANSLLDLTVKWDDAVIDSVGSVIPSTTQAYRFRNVPFTPAAESGRLEFGSAVTGDSTLLLDGVSIVQRDDGQVVVQNPSFEASGDLPETGVATGPIAGWAITGTVGINTEAGPFANNGAIPDQDHVLFIQQAGSVTQTIRGLIAGKPYTVALSVNARTGNTPQVLVTANGTTVLDKAVTAAGGTAAYQTVTGTFTADADSTELVISQTVGAGDQTLLVDNVKITGEALAPLPPLIVGPSSLELAPGSKDSVSITVSKERLARGASTVVLRSANPGVAEFTNVGVDGSVALNFPAGADTTTLTAEIEGFARGLAAINVEDNGGHDEIQGSIAANVVTSFVRNASFEGSAVPASPGYGAISAWTQSSTQNTGLNTSAGPFADNGDIPDRTQVALMQGNNSISQIIYGLTPGQRYWLQFAYNARTCCGGTPNLHASLDNTVIGEALGIEPVGSGPYHLFHAEFTATAEMAELKISSDVPNGDGTVVLDGVSIVQRDAGEIVVMNPSFESSGIANGVGYISADRIMGWQMTGGYGVNVDERGPFTDNGTAGAQDRVLFMQNAASATQTISGLTAGKTYNLSFLLNARNADAAGGTPYQIVVDDIVLEEGVQDPVGAGSPYNAKSLSFVASSDTAVIAFKSVPPNTEDQTLLLDDVRVTAAGAAATVTLNIESLAGNSVVLRWPASAPASLVLKTSTTLSGGVWDTVTTPVIVENGQNTVVLPFNGTRRFYNLFQP
ncbi:MAG: hypothetical protein JWM59_162 [Verrucomicrobiales bacterium]|nr:hypothetical protein [Verrucomicrobiales bacterium]